MLNVIGGLLFGFIPLQQSENGNTCVQSPYPNKLKKCDDPPADNKMVTSLF
jgi:hypothetical protein